MRVPLATLSRLTSGLKPVTKAKQIPTEGNKSVTGTCCVTNYHLDGQLVVSSEFSPNTGAFVPMVVFDSTTEQPSLVTDTIMN